MNAIRNYIKESNSLGHRPRGLFLFNRIPFQVAEEYPNHIDLLSVIERIEKIIPEWCFDEIEEIFVGEFKTLKERNVNSVYEDGAIYLLNKRDNEEHVFDDILHEVAHSLEHKFSEEIYSDFQLEKEFLGKRRKLAELLKYDNIFVPNSYVENVEYDENFDSFLNEELGYDKLSQYTEDLFINPYSVTSLSEYLAVSFEKYFSGEHQNKLMVKSISPVAYNKLKEIELENAS